MPHRGRFLLIRTCAAALVVLIAGVRPATADFLIIGSNPTTELAVPFGLACDGPSDPSDRCQQDFAASLFRGPIAITALTFYAQAPGAGGLFNPVIFNFGLATTTTPVGALTPTSLGGNVGANATQFATVSPTGSAPTT